MKKLVWKCLLLVLPLVTGLFIINGLYVRTEIWKGEFERFKSVPEHIQVANLGSSHGGSFDYDQFPYTGFTFALGGQRFLYDYGILSQYIDRFEQNAVLFILVSYFQITQPASYKIWRARYYQFLRKEYLDYYSWEEHLLYTLVPVLTADDPLNAILNGDEAELQFSKVVTEPELTQSAVSFYRAWTNDRLYPAEVREEGFAYNQYWIRKIIDLCYAKGIQPVLVTTPVTSALNNVFQEQEPAFFDDFYRFTRELQETWPALPYLDYSHDPRFGSELFFDSHHLNRAGAEQFTAALIADLPANGIVIPGSH